MAEDKYFSLRPETWARIERALQWVEQVMANPFPWWRAMVRRAGGGVGTTVWSAQVTSAPGLTDRFVSVRRISEPDVYIDEVAVLAQCRIYPIVTGYGIGRAVPRLEAGLYVDVCVNPRQSATGYPYLVMDTFIAARECYA